MFDPGTFSPKEKKIEKLVFLGEIFQTQTKEIWPNPSNKNLIWPKPGQRFLTQTHHYSKDKQETN